MELDILKTRRNAKEKRIMIWITLLIGYVMGTLMTSVLSINNQNELEYELNKVTKERDYWKSKCDINENKG